MKFGVITFPGSTGSQDVIEVINSLTGVETTKIWHKDADLQGCDFIVLPSGFAYFNDKNFVSMKQFSPIMHQVILHAAKGKFILGIGSGFQLLTASELLPGVLTSNNSGNFISKNVFIKPQSKSSSFISRLDFNKAYRVPIALRDGKYDTDENTLKGLNDNDQVVFRYCDGQGEISQKSNPYGSVQNIAGIRNKANTIFGLIPQPERAAHYELGLTDGKEIFESILQLV